MHFMTTSTMLALTAVFTLVGSSPQRVGEVNPEARLLFEQQLTNFDDVCEDQRALSIRHVRFATLDASGRVEDRLELRTTTRTGEAARAVDYLVNDTVMFTRRSGGDLKPTVAGRQFLSARDGRRTAKLLAAFAAAQPRIFAMDIETPTHSCGTLAGKAEETAKCGAIGVLGCVSGNPLVCGVSAGLAVLCSYLVDKTCEADPDSCQPGWTEG